MLLAVSSDGTASTITSDKVLCCNGDDFSLVFAVLSDDALDEVDGDGVGGRVRVLAAVDLVRLEGVGSSYSKTVAVHVTEESLLNHALLKTECA